MTIKIDGILFDPLLKARNRFESFRQNLETDQEKAGAIQAFEYTFELTWKTMKKLAEERGGIPFVIRGSKDIFRAIEHLHFIDNAETWHKFIAARNNTSHSYNEEDADAVIEVFEDFSKELSTFLKNVGAL